MNHVPGNSAGDLFGMVKTWPFQRLSDLQLGDKMVTLNHLVQMPFFCVFSWPFQDPGIYRVSMHRARWEGAETQQNHLPSKECGWVCGWLYQLPQAERQRPICSRWDVPRWRANSANCSKQSYENAGNRLLFQCWPWIYWEVQPKDSHDTSSSF